MNSVDRLIIRCRKLGASMPNSVDHSIIVKLLAKLIVEEHVNDEEAFEIASKAYAEGFIKRNNKTDEKDI